MMRSWPEFSSQLPPGPGVTYSHLFRPLLPCELEVMRCISWAMRRSVTRLVH